MCGLRKPPILNIFLTNTNNKRQGRLQRPKNNSTKQSTTGAPSYKVTPGGGMIISHREFVGTINENTSTTETITSGNFRTNPVPLKVTMQPGDGRAFPWLNQIAVRFEKYKIRKLMYIYEPTCATTTSGGIALCPIYDPADPVPANRSNLLNAEGVVRGAVHNELRLNIPQRRMRQNDTLFVRETHEGLMDANELRLTDLGYLAVSLSDATVGLNYGDLFVEYTIELNSPRVGSRIGKSASISRRNFTPVSASTNPSYTSMFGTVANGGASVASRLHHAPSSTLMLDVEHIQELGTPLDTIDTNRFTFKEPFTGQVTFACKCNDGTTSVRHRIQQQRVSPTSPSRPWATLSTISALAESGVSSAIYNVVAEAGDTISLVLDGATGKLLDWASATFADMAPELLPLLIL
jgi:hypothetical protein